MTQGGTVAILIPIYNRLNNIDSCFDSLLKNTYQDYKIVIIDDGSTDGSAEHIKANYPETEILKGDGNLWWAGAINLGIDYALANNFKYVLTFNDDQICQNDFLDKLMQYASDSSILSSLILYQSDRNKILSSGILFDYKKAQTRGFKNENSIQEIGNMPYQVEASPGYSLLIPTTVLRTFGKFDHLRFPQINMELEFCLRMRRNGISIFVIPESIVWNDRSDKSDDPISFTNPWKRAKWFTSNIKSDLSFKQSQHLYKMLLEYCNGSQYLLFFRHWFRYSTKVFFKSLFTKQKRHKLTGFLHYNKDFWA
jgi:GT2 family glycosyltransferase